MSSRTANRGWALALLAFLPFGAFAANDCDPKAQIESNAQEVDEGVTVKLNGVPSKDEDTYLWEVVSGPALTFSPNATDGKPSFVAPQVSETKSVVIRLTVRGCSPALTNSTTTTIIIRDTNAPANTPPTVTAAANPPIAGESASVALNGTAQDAQGGPLTYSWTQVANGAPAVTIQNANQLNASFVTPHLTGPSATFAFTLTVTDSGGLPGTATALVNVTFANDSPFAALNCPEVVNEGQNVTLQGTASDYEDDYNNLPLIYSWSQKKGPPNIDVASTTTKSVSFIAPVLGLGDLGGIEFTFTAKDSQGAYTTAECGVFITDVTAPVFGFAGDLVEEATSPAGAPVTFSLTATDNVQGDVSTNISCTPASGSTFALGKTKVDCSVEDANHNHADTSFNVTVRDTTKPVIDAHAAVAVEADGPNGSIVDYTSPDTFDVVDVNLVATCLPGSGTLFSLGSHDVNCSATDFAGNVALPTKFKVTVHDTQKPTLTMPEDQTEEATSANGAVATFAPTATDTVDLDVAIVCTPVSGSTFPLGKTQVDCTATDDSGNASDGSFFVNVVDTTPPVVTVPEEDITKEATAPQGAAIDFAVSASDAVTSPISPVCIIGPDMPVQSGDFFPVGVHTVSCSATDEAGNTGKANFKITVTDTTPPTVVVPANLVIEATGPDGAAATFTASASDIVSGSITPKCSIVGPDLEVHSGDTFPLGTTTVECSATDGAGNTGSKSFTIKVQDTTAPDVTVPANKIAEATGPNGAAVQFTVAALDIVSGQISPVCIIGPDHPVQSGDVFPLGTTTVECSAKDAAGNTGTKSFTIKVQDTTAPDVTVPANKTAEATGPNGAAVDFSATAIDIVSGPLSPVCIVGPDHEVHSGDTFPLGKSTLTCTATDGAGNSAGKSFDITIVDTTAPVIAHHDDVLATAVGGKAIVSYTKPVATDLVDGIVPVTCDPASGIEYGVGTTAINCTAQDGRTPANKSTSSFNVVVHYTFDGFFSPVDKLPIVNLVQAGQAIPVKFSLGGNQGMSIFAAGNPKSAAMTCNGGAQDTVEETTTAGSSSLQYDAGTGRYIYVWKTEKGWAGTCRQLQITFADGTTQKANFQFKK